MEPQKQDEKTRSLNSHPVVHEEELFIDSKGLSPTSPSSDGSNIAFTRAAIAFKGTLDDVRHKRDSGATTLASPTTPDLKKTPTVTVDPGAEEETEEATDKTVGIIDSGLSRSIRLLRTFQSLLTSVISLTIAFLQGRIYVLYLKNKDVAGAWPQQPDLFPTILLMAVAIAATVFDISMLVAYCLPKNKRLYKTLMKIARGSHTFVVTAKTASYAVTAAVCKSGFNFGMSSSQNNDLWSWTCTDPAMLNTITSASSQCTSQDWAWYFSLINIGIETVGGIVNILLFIQQQRQKKKAETDEDYDKMGEDINGELGEVTPDQKA